MKQLPKNLSIVYFGTPQFSAYILEKLLEFCESPTSFALHPRGVNTNQPKFTIQTVITRADRPVGRHQTVSESSVAMVAKKYNIPTLKPLKLNEEFIQNHLSFLECDLFVVASYGKIIPQALLDIPKLGSLNVHGSILPKYRGASPIQAAILNGDKKTGVSIMLINQEMDHGPVLSTREISISDNDTFYSLSNKMAQVGSEVLVKTLVDFVGGKIKAKEQTHFKATYTKLIKKEAGFIDIDDPPSLTILDRKIRAYYPWPGVWTRWNNKIVKFYPEGKIQMEGKKIVSLKDFLNGYPDFPIKNLN